MVTKEYELKRCRDRCGSYSGTNAADCFSSCNGVERHGIPNEFPNRIPNEFPNRIPNGIPKIYQ